MRSTQKKGPRTPALVRQRRRQFGAEGMYSAVQGASTSATAINAAWSRSIASALDGSDAERIAVNLIARSAGREPPEPEAAVQDSPKPPLRPVDGATRPISMVTLPDGTVRMEVGERTLCVSLWELERLRSFWGCSRARRGM